MMCGCAKDHARLVLVLPFFRIELKAATALQSAGYTAVYWPLRK